VSSRPESAKWRDPDLTRLSGRGRHSSSSVGEGPNSKLPVRLLDPAGMRCLIATKFRGELFSLTTARILVPIEYGKFSGPLHTPNPPENLPNRPFSPQSGCATANAMKSTGRVTSEGMAASRLNALKQGFLRRDVVNPVLTETLAPRNSIRSRRPTRSSSQPESARERILIDEVAACCWRIRRILRYECESRGGNEESARRYAASATPTRRCFSDGS